MIRSQLSPMPEYFDRYINLADDVTVLEAIQNSLTALENAPLDQWTALGDAVYAPGKWTIKDILQHIIDTERVFAYRALAFARGETEARSFDEEQYGALANANNRTLTDLLEEAIAVRKTSLYLYKSFDATMLAREGMGFKGPYSVHSIGFMMAGHQCWHFNVVEERYLPLLK